MILSTADGSCPGLNDNGTDELLNVLLNSQWSSHFFNVLNFPPPEVSRFCSNPVSPHLY